jgi:hypothetical protein
VPSGLLHATDRCIPGSQCSAAGARRPGSVVIDNDKLPSSTHAADSSAEERAYGQPGTAINQIADYPDASALARRPPAATRAARSRRAPPAI